MLHIINHKTKLVTYARENRKKSTPGEIKLWSYLKAKRLLGFKFRRQTPILYYIVDFYCHEKRLVIEVDGESHNEDTFEYDQMRQRHIESLEIKILRFTEYSVTKDISAVIQAIVNELSGN